MKLKSRLLMLFFAGMTPYSASTLRASLVVTYTGLPNAETSSLTGAKVFNFNALPTGVNTNVSWSGVGTFNKLNVSNPNLYGGAGDAVNTNGTRYSIQGLGGPVSTTTLTLTQNSGYFGFWWSAGDASNVLSFYEQGVLVAQFTTATLLATLGPSYDGNPRNRTQNPTQPYAFVNVFGDATTKWDTITFTGTSTSASFESDNYSSRVSTYNPALDGSILPGVAVERVSGNTVSIVSPSATGAALWGSSEAVPGAPAPSVYLLGVLGLAFFAKSRISRAKAAPSDA